MAKAKPTLDRPIPKVRIARPAGRPYQLRYTDAETSREIRLSVGTRNEDDAQRLKREVEAKLLLGHDAAPRVRTRGPSMRWEDFRDDYSRLKLATLRADTARDTETRLDVCERIIKPRTLGDMAKAESLTLLKAELLVGSGTSRREIQPRSPHTVNSYLRDVVAALNWAYRQRWLPSATLKQEIATDDPAKGRPICLEEFERMLAAAELVCAYDPEPWQYLLWGLWESGLRVSEAMDLSFDVAGTIQVVRERRGVVYRSRGGTRRTAGTS